MELQPSPVFLTDAECADVKGRLRQPGTVIWRRGMRFRCQADKTFGPAEPYLSWRNQTFISEDDFIAAVEAKLGHVGFLGFGDTHIEIEIEGKWYVFATTGRGRGQNEGCAMVADCPSRPIQ